MTNKNKTNKVLLRWEVKEAQKATYNIPWIIGFFALIIAVLVYALLTKKWFTSAVFVITIIILVWYLISQEKPLNILLTDKGIWVNKQFYNFDKIKGYWISEKSKTIYLVPKFRGAPTIAIPVGKYKLESIIKMFPSDLIKMESREDILDIISGLLKR